VKDFLKQNKIEFEDIDVAANREAAKEMITKSGQMAVPVLDIDGAIIVGADMGAIKKALKMAE
jgi:glutaredoxin